MNYNNRIGTILQNNLPFRTNIGTSVSKGIESFVEIHPMKMIGSSSKVGNLSFFGSFAYVDARYTRWDNPAIENDPDRTIVNKKVENAPRIIGRYGANYQLKRFSASFLLNQVGEVYADAANTELPNTGATIGKIDAYTVMDASLSMFLGKHYQLKAGVNNLADATYATRRAGGYPGPGLMPGNGRTFFLTVGAKF